jgi:hypothetical protein
VAGWAGTGGREGWPFNFGVGEGAGWPEP